MRRSKQAKLFLLTLILLVAFNIEEVTLETIEAHPSVAPLAADSSDPLTFTVTGTAYTPAPKETWGDPWLTRSGRRLRPGTTLAVSRDIWARPDIKFGQKARILNYGILRTCAFVIDNTIGAGIVKSIDLALLTKKYAFRWGRRYNLKVEILPEDDKTPLCTLPKVRAQIDKLYGRR